MKFSVLITGCSSGIGLAAAQRLQKLGYLVIASARTETDVEKLKALGLEHVVVLDLTCEESIAEGLNAALAITGGELYGLFNNGAYGQPGAVEDLPTSALREQFETNVFGTHDLTNRVIKIMLKQGYGRIVQNSSVLGLVAAPFRGAYNASKFALEGLTDTLRMELADTPIQVSLIEPGPIESQFRVNALKALQKNIDISESRHKKGYEDAIARLSNPGPASKYTLKADAVVDKLQHALEAKKAKPQYFVTTPTYFADVFRRVLPTRLLDLIMRSQGS
ncbi:SDR family NAD(P)-dependent oxidoreductase [Marinomonas balearica]|uniref:Short-subunit dehydrogenase n=1 Tax=Marinomonas balearica TaxID=491947 RepID=A0A4R6M9K3_9GAMM|nr:SDR family NAD(P)-dependent oxidoreductase [Marinomonas balearica]TDO98113.1 short-subunit dehydrogenase [Marinomonas balearica]